MDVVKVMLARLSFEISSCMIINFGIFKLSYRLTVSCLAALLSSVDNVRCTSFFILGRNESAT